MSDVDWILYIKRLPKPGKSSYYDWMAEADGERVAGGNDLETIRACLIDMASSLSDIETQIKVVYRDVPVGSFSAGACIDIPEEIADTIVDRHSTIVEAGM